MASYAIYNYQFEPNFEQARQCELEGMGVIRMSLEDAFEKKQELFGDLLMKDFKKVRPEDVIHFTYGKGSKEYIHRHLIPPTDNIAIMRVANRKMQTIVDEQLRDKRVEDYQNSIVIIDNRPGIQRILVENKKAAFRDVKQLANILQFTFNKYLRCYCLAIRLDHLQDSRHFWQYANDRRSFPLGFYRVSFKLPYPNLERLRKVYDRLFSKARESFDCRLDMDFVSPKGEVRLREDDAYQNEAIKWVMEDAGGEVNLYSNQSKRSPIVVGKNSYLTTSVSNSVIQRVVEDAVNDDMFGSAAFNEIKRTTKTGIDPDK